jgi:hypothetical protein
LSIKEEEQSQKEEVMGFLTTITIRNDHCDGIRDKPLEFAEDVYQACLGNTTRTVGGKEVRLGSCANGIILQRPRHADDHAIYVHRGNTVQIMSPYDKETKELLTRCPEFFDKCLKQMREDVRELTKMQKERKETERLNKKEW